MDKLDSLLRKTLAKRGLLDEATASQVVHAANSWIAERDLVLSNQLRAQSFRDAILTLKSQNSIASQEGTMFSEDLLEHLRAEFPSDRIESIVVVRA